MHNVKLELIFSQTINLYHIKSLVQRQSGALTLLLSNGHIQNVDLGMVICVVMEVNDK